jgi:hypothetical protein
VDRDVVGLREELVQGHRVDLHPLGAARRQVGVERHDPHPEGLGPAGDLAAYPAEPDHPEGLPEELDARERLPVPLSVAHGGGGLGHGTCTAEKVREGELGRRDRVARRRVHDDDAAFRRGFDVDIVDAHPGPSNDLEQRGRRDHLGRDFRFRAHRDRVHVLHEFEELLRRGPVCLNDFDPRLRAKPGDTLR